MIIMMSNDTINDATSWMNENSDTFKVLCDNGIISKIPADKFAFGRKYHKTSPNTNKRMKDDSGMFIEDCCVVDVMQAFCTDTVIDDAKLNSMKEKIDDAQKKRRDGYKGIDPKYIHLVDVNFMQYFENKVFQQNIANRLDINAGDLILTVCAIQKALSGITLHTSTDDVIIGHYPDESKLWLSIHANKSYQFDIPAFGTPRNSDRKNVPDELYIDNIFYCMRYVYDYRDALSKACSSIF